MFVAVHFSLVSAQLTVNVNDKLAQAVPRSSRIREPASLEVIKCQSVIGGAQALERVPKLFVRVRLPEFFFWSAGSNPHAQHDRVLQAYDACWHLWPRRLWLPFALHVCSGGEEGMLLALSFSLDLTFFSSWKGQDEDLYCACCVLLCVRAVCELLSSSWLFYQGFE
jgi:hypothetical protein